MTIDESCSCGATFTVDADSGDALGAVMSWRNTHRHEEPVDEVGEGDGE